MSTKKKAACALCVALLATVATVNAQSVLRLDGASRVVRTMLGCTETLICEGIASEMEWSKGSDDLSNNTVVDSLDDGALRSFLTLTDITMSNGGKYVCNLDGAKSLSIPTTIEVENTYVRIDPIKNIDISSVYVGTTLPLECTVTTCQEKVTVSILKGSQLVSEKTFTGENHIVLRSNLTVTADTADPCACRVLLPNGEVYMKSFSISGTPLGIRSGVNNAPAPDKFKTTNPTSHGHGSASINLPPITTIAVLLLILAAALDL